MLIRSREVFTGRVTRLTVDTVELPNGHRADLEVLHHPGGAAVVAIDGERRVVGALLSAIPGLGSIAMVLALVFYVSAVIATGLFGADFPEWFGNLGRSVYTLFQVMTLESWSMGIVRPLMDVFPYAWVFFIPFILIATFTMLNLFIAIIVNAMQTVTDAEHEATQASIEAAREHIEADLHEEVRALRGEIAELKDLLRGQARR